MSNELFYFSHQSMPSAKKTQRLEKKLRIDEREAKIDDAVKEILKGKAARTAGREYGVPESTLRRRVREIRAGKTERHPTSSYTTFTPFQEDLANHCIKMSRLGYGYTAWQIIDMAVNMARLVNAKRIPGTDWFYKGFMARHPDLKMVNPRKREKAREAVTEEIINNYFRDLESVLEEVGLKDIPAKIWNLDETGISLDHKSPKVLASASERAFYVSAGKSPTTTLISAVSALGQTLPPYMIFKGQRVTPGMKEGTVPGTVFTSSESGWINSTIFLDFFKNHFLKNIKERPLILFYDGHATHYTADVISAARDDNVHLFVLPPHSSHLLQPLDVTVFSPFKNKLRHCVHKWMAGHPTRVITRDELPGLICQAIQGSMTVPTIMSGFRATGIFPFNKDVVRPKVVERTPASKPSETRKGRNDTRNIKMLLDGAISPFERKNTEPVQKRKRFIPPHGALVSTAAFANDKRHREQQSTSKAAPYIPPFTRHIINQSGDFSEELIEAGKGLSRGKGKGKGKATKRKSTGLPNHSEDNTLTASEYEDECCIVCGLDEPEGVSTKNRKIDWGACDKCDRWVHLGSCTEVKQIGRGEDFLCPICANEQ